MHEVRAAVKDPKQAEMQVKMMLNTLLKEVVPDENPKVPLAPPGVG